MKLVKSLLTKNPCYTAGKKITVKRVPIAAFYGAIVYCDIDFENGSIYEVEYETDNDHYRGIVDLDKGFQENDFDEYVAPVMRAWYEDNKHFLQQIWETRVLIDIPNWEE